MTITLKASAKELKEVASGKKKVITREIRPGNAKKFVRLNEQEECVGIIDYDRITLHNDTLGAFVIARIEKVMLMEIEDENGELVFYEQNGNKYEAVDWDAHLGEILEISKNVPIV